LWFTDIALVFSLLAIAEVMFRVGRSLRRRADEHVRSQTTAAQASSLGMLALILGFTLSMADARFDARRTMLLREATAAGTTYLRTDYLPEPARSESRALLRDYVKVRRAYARASAAEAVVEVSRARAIQVQLWARAAITARAHLDSALVGHYVEALNEMIDLEETRDVVVLARLPPTVMMLLFLVALVAVGISGYAAGLGGRRAAVTLVVMPTLIALACAIVADLERARAGYIATGDLPMQRLEESMSGQNRTEAASDSVSPF
jgi:hypothetical protein